MCLGLDGTGVPVRPSEVAGRRGKQPGGTKARRRPAPVRARAATTADPPFPGALPRSAQTCEHAGMKTTLDLPDTALRRARAAAADHGVTLQQFVAEALDEKLHRASAARPSPGDAEPPWMAGFGALADLREENRRIEALIEDEFEKLPATEDA